MRWLISSILIAAGGMLLYLFAEGAFVEPRNGIAGEASWASSIGLLWKLDLRSAAVLFVSMSSLVYGTGSLFIGPEAVFAGQSSSSPSASQRSASPRRSSSTRWGAALHIAYGVNVFASAGLIVILSLSVGDAASRSMVGHLYLLCLLMALVGSFLAFALIWQKKSKILYASTATVHLLEVIVLGAIFTFGFGG